jgi:hypothetical protein
VDEIKLRGWSVWLSVVVSIPASFDTLGAAVKAMLNNVHKKLKY